MPSDSDIVFTDLGADSILIIETKERDHDPDSTWRFETSYKSFDYMGDGDDDEYRLYIFGATKNGATYMHFTAEETQAIIAYMKIMEKKWEEKHGTDS